MPHVNELHEQHDPILIVSFASGDLSAERDHAAAQSLIDSCADCARLHDDILAIARATAALPPATRPRDFSISSEQAARLHPGGLRGFLARLAAPGNVFGRQVAMGLTTLGVAGLLFSALSSVAIPAGGAAAPSAAPAQHESARGSEGAFAVGPVGAPGASPAASAPAESAPPAGGSGAYGVTSGPAAPSPSVYFDTSGGEPAPTAKGVEGRTTDTPTAAPAASDRPGVALAFGDGGGTSSGGQNWLLIASVVALVTGLLLLLGRSVGRRLTSV
jgi:hypothetical protein